MPKADISENQLIINQAKGALSKGILLDNLELFIKCLDIDPEGLPAEDKKNLLIILNKKEEFFAKVGDRVREVETQVVDATHLPGPDKFPKWKEILGAYSSSETYSQTFYENCRRIAEQFNTSEDLSKLSPKDLIFFTERFYRLPENDDCREALRKIANLVPEKENEFDDSDREILSDLFNRALFHQEIFTGDVYQNDFLKAIEALRKVKIKFPFTEDDYKALTKNNSGSQVLFMSSENRMLFNHLHLMSSVNGITLYPFDEGVGLEAEDDLQSDSLAVVCVLDQSIVHTTSDPFTEEMLVETPSLHLPLYVYGNVSQRGVYIDSLLGDVSEQLNSFVKEENRLKHQAFLADIDWTMKLNRGRANSFTKFDNGPDFDTKRTDFDRRGSNPVIDPQIWNPTTAVQNWLEDEAVESTNNFKKIRDKLSAYSMPVANPEATLLIGSPGTDLIKGILADSVAQENPEGRSIIIDPQAMLLDHPNRALLQKEPNQKTMSKAYEDVEDWRWRLFTFSVSGKHNIAGIFSGESDSVRKALNQLTSHQYPTKVRLIADNQHISLLQMALDQAERILADQTGDDWVTFPQTKKMHDDAYNDTPSLIKDMLGKKSVSEIFFHAADGTALISASLENDEWTNSRSIEETPKELKDIAISEWLVALRSRSLSEKERSEYEDKFKQIIKIQEASGVNESDRQFVKQMCVEAFTDFAKFADQEMSQEQIQTQVSTLTRASLHEYYRLPITSPKQDFEPWRIVIEALNNSPQDDRSSRRLSLIAFAFNQLNAQDLTSCTAPQLVAFANYFLQHLQENQQCRDALHLITRSIVLNESLHQDTSDEVNEDLYIAARELMAYGDNHGENDYCADCLQAIRQLNSWESEFPFDLTQYEQLQNEYASESNIHFFTTSISFISDEQGEISYGELTEEQINSNDISEGKRYLIMPLHGIQDKKNPENRAENFPSLNHHLVVLHDLNTGTHEYFDSLQGNVRNNLQQYLNKQKELDQRRELEEQEKLEQERKEAKENEVFEKLFKALDSQNRSDLEESLSELTEIGLDNEEKLLARLLENDQWIERFAEKEKDELVRIQKKLALEVNEKDSEKKAKTFISAINEGMSYYNKDARTATGRWETSLTRKGFNKDEKIFLRLALELVRNNEGLNFQGVQSVEDMKTLMARSMKMAYRTKLSKEVLTPFFNIPNLPEPLPEIPDTPKELVRSLIDVINKGDAENTKTYLLDIIRKHTNDEARDFTDAILKYLGKTSEWSVLERGIFSTLNTPQGEIPDYQQRLENLKSPIPLKSNQKTQVWKEGNNFLNSSPEQRQPMSLTIGSEKIQPVTDAIQILLDLSKQSNFPDEANVDTVGTVALNAIKSHRAKLLPIYLAPLILMANGQSLEQALRASQFEQRLADLIKGESDQKSLSPKDQEELKPDDKKTPPQNDDKATLPQEDTPKESRTPNYPTVPKEFASEDSSYVRETALKILIPMRAENISETEKLLSEAIGNISIHSGNVFNRQIATLATHFVDDEEWESFSKVVDYVVPFETLTDEELENLSNKQRALDKYEKKAQGSQSSTSESIDEGILEKRQIIVSQYLSSYSKPFVNAQKVINLLKAGQIQSMEAQLQEIIDRAEDSEVFTQLLMRNPLWQKHLRESPKTQQQMSQLSESIVTIESLAAAVGDQKNVIYADSVKNFIAKVDGNENPRQVYDDAIHAPEIDPSHEVIFRSTCLAMQSRAKRSLPIADKFPEMVQQLKDNLEMEVTTNYLDSLSRSRWLAGLLKNPSLQESDIITKVQGALIDYSDSDLTSTASYMARQPDRKLIDRFIYPPSPRNENQETFSNSGDEEVLSNSEDEDSLSSSIADWNTLCYRMPFDEELDKQCCKGINTLQEIPDMSEMTDETVDTYFPILDDTHHGYVMTISSTLYEHSHIDETYAITSLEEGRLKALAHLKKDILDGYEYADQTFLEQHKQKAIQLAASQVAETPPTTSFQPYPINETLQSIVNLTSSTISEPEKKQVQMNLATSLIENGLEETDKYFKDQLIEKLAKDPNIDNAFLRHKEMQFKEMKDKIQWQEGSGLPKWELSKDAATTYKDAVFGYSINKGMSLPNARANWIITLREGPQANLNCFTEIRNYYERLKKPIKDNLHEAQKEVLKSLDKEHAQWKPTEKEKIAWIKNLVTESIKAAIQEYDKTFHVRTYAQLSDEERAVIQNKNYTLIRLKGAEAGRNITIRSITYESDGKIIKSVLAQHNHTNDVYLVIREAINLEDLAKVKLDQSCQIRIGDPALAIAKKRKNQLQRDIGQGTIAM